MNAIKALSLLKSGYILEGTNEANCSRFLLENNKVKVIDANFNLSLSTTDFLEIYSKYNFSLIEDDEAPIGIDENKDKEYYSSLQKRQ